MTYWMIKKSGMLLHKSKESERITRKQNCERKIKNEYKGINSGCGSRNTHEV